MWETKNSRKIGKIWSREECLRLAGIKEVKKENERKMDKNNNKRGISKDGDRIEELLKRIDGNMF